MEPSKTAVQPKTLEEIHESIYSTEVMLGLMANFIKVFVNLLPY